MRNMFSKRTKDGSLVVAHFMLGNTYSYDDAVWKRQFDLAVEAGLDGFVLNLGPEDWQWAQALSAARLCLPAFHLCLSLDLNVLPPSLSLLVDRVSTFARAEGGRHQLRVDGKVFVSTFGGGGLDLGGGGWGEFKGTLNDSGVPIYFAPAFFLPPKSIVDDPAVDCLFAWNSAWEIDGPSTGSPEEREFVASGKPYMAAVSPCFFTHYGTQPPFAFNKNSIYGTDCGWYARRWLQVLESQRRPKVVQVLSWNDYGESHHIGPVELDQPGSQAWTTGLPHSALLSLTAYFILLLKNPSSPPSPDKVWIWYRTHLKNGLAEMDPIGRPANADWARDEVSVFSSLPDKGKRWTLACSSSPKLLVLESGKSQTLDLGPGRMRFTLKRGDKVIGELEGVPMRESVEAYNFNVWSGVLSAASR